MKPINLNEIEQWWREGGGTRSDDPIQNMITELRELRVKVQKLSPLGQLKIACANRACDTGVFNIEDACGCIRCCAAICPACLKRDRSFCAECYANCLAAFTVGKVES